jgi:S1-C subfamily serine protease
MVERVRPGIVRVETINEWSRGNTLFKTSGSGSGVIYSKSTDGSALVLTNYHVVEGATSVEIVVNDSTTYKTSLRGIDTGRDLAVLSICCADFTALTLEDGDEIASGTEIVVMGYPLGLSGTATVSRGIVSAVRYDSDADRWLIQTDASINPGSSGGPMLSLTGEFVGITTSKIVSSGGGVPVEGIGFAVSNKTLLEQLPKLNTGEAMAFPTHTPLPPTPTPTPTRFKLRVNGAEFSEDGIVRLGRGTIKASPPPDQDGTYEKGTVVSLALFNDNAGSGGLVTGADSVNPNGIATVVMNSDRLVSVTFY